MKGDFSRETFDAGLGYTGVLMQQGRVQLDADFNEQGAISRDFWRSLARDLVGPHGGPVDCLGFGCITSASEILQWLSLSREVGAMACTNFAGGVDWNRDFLITPGRYYVDGMLVENDRLIRYSDRADPGARDAFIAEHESFVVHLQVFERVVTAMEDPRLLEPALGGTDTTLRLQVRWQVRLQSHHGERVSARELPLLSRVRYGLMTAQTHPSRAGDSDRKGYTGLEIRLYRIEIHAGAETGTPTFKWSRNNGAYVRAVRQPAAEPTGNHLTLDLLPAIGAAAPPCSIDVDAFVELLPEFDPGPHVQGPLLRVLASSSDGNSLTLDTTGAVVDPRRLRLLRRWDQRGGAIPVPGDAKPVAIEDGIEVVFDATTRSDLRSGDYWVIAARLSVADIDWPRVCDASSGCARPVARPPNGPRSASAPLGILRRTDGGAGWTFEDGRRQFGPIAT